MTFDAQLSLFALLISGAMAVMIATVLRWFSDARSSAHYRHWAAAWGAEGAYYLIGALSFVLAHQQVGSVGVRLGVSMATQVANTLAGALMIIGAIGFVQRRLVDRRQLAIALAVAVILGSAVSLAAFAMDSRNLRLIYHSAVTATAFLGSAIVIWRSLGERNRPGRLMAVALGLYGASHLHYFVYWSMRAAGRVPEYPFSLNWLSLLDLLWIASVAATMAAMGLADERAGGNRAIERREREFRQQIEYSSDIIAVLDASLAVQYASPSARRLLGWGEEALGQHIFDFVNEGDRPRLERQSAAEPAATPPFLARVRHKDGNWVQLEVVTSRGVDLEGNPVVIINARDVGERARLEASLRESQKLESVGRLAGGIAHDLNNILTVIAGHAQLSLPASTGLVREGLVEIGAASRRAADLTRQLLSFARRQVVAPRVFNVYDTVSGTARMAARLLPESITFHITPSAADHYAFADPGQVEQVVMNLVVNARDAIRGGGEITLDVDHTTVDPGEDPEAPAGHYVTIAVSDTGSGMTEQVLTHLFEPFFTTKAMGEGTGLGLATSYGIVRQAGGFIRVSSELGVGSTFTVYLPEVAAPAESPDTVLPSEAPVADGEVVLLVEDDDAVRALQATVLTGSGFRVISAGDGREALQLADANPDVCILVSDVVMPRMGGLELARRLRVRFPQLGILLLSGYPGEVDFLSTLPPGAEFLQKPVSPSELVKRVHRLVAASTVSATAPAGSSAPPRSTP